MGNYDTTQRARRAQERRAAIIERLGGKCAYCGTKGGRKNKLEIDHIQPRDWYLRAFSQLGRVRIYEQEEKAGKLQVLCATCNKTKGNRVMAGAAGS